MSNFCSVLSCRSTSSRDKVSFFRIPSISDYGKNIDPKTQRRRDAWIAALRRSDLTESTLKYGVVCSRHFLRGKPAELEDEQDPDWLPTQNMGYEKDDRTYSMRKRMKVDTDDYKQQEVVDNYTEHLSTDLREISQELEDYVDIKQEVDGGDDFSNSSNAAENADEDLTANSFVKQETDLCNDSHLYIKQEEIDIKDEDSSWASESCGDVNDYFESSNESDSDDEINSTANENFSEKIQLDPGYKKACPSTLPSVTMDMIHDFYINIYLTTHLKGIKSSENRNENYGDEAIKYVQLSRQNCTITLKCKVTPDQEAKEKMYDAKIIINERDRKIESCQCLDCSAEEGECKHAICFLYWLHRRTEDPSPNQDQSYWTKPILNIGKQFVTCKDFGEVPESISVDSSNFLELFIQNAPKNCDAPILKYYRNEPSADLHKLMVQFVNGDFDLDINSFLNFCRDTVTNTMCNDAFRNTTQQSQDELWLELRYGRITSSTLYEASRWNPYGTLNDFILGIINHFDTKSMKRENKLKKFVLKEVGNLRKIHILSPGGIQLEPEYPIFGATTDGITEEYCILVKCPSKESKMTKYIVGNKMKEKFYCQIMLQLHLCKKEKGLFCVAAPDFEETKNVHIIDVIYNRNYLMKKMEEASAFWRENIFPILLKSCKIN